MPDIQLLLGPLLGFLFTAGTLLFVAMNAHKTAAPATAQGPDTVAAAPDAAPQPAQEAPPSDQP